MEQTSVAKDRGDMLTRDEKPGSVLERFLGKTDHQLFWITLVIFIIIAGLGVMAPDRLAAALQVLQAFITTHFTWYYLLFTAACLGFSCGPQPGPMPN